METVKKYKTHVYLSKLQTIISHLLPGDNPENSSLLVLEETIFFPGGGGQSSDLGTIAGLDLTRVFEKDQIIYHELPFSLEQLQEKGLAAGSLCEIELDWHRRFDNMQRHCGEHILSGVCFDLWRGINRGFHMGQDYMTIDISLEDSPYDQITRDMLAEAELRANQIIWQDLPVVASHYDTKEEARGLNLRKELTIERDITIVTIGDENNPADSVACCGTHPSTSGQIGMIKLYKVEPNKGMFRIFFEAGERALMEYRKKQEILDQLGEDLSAGTEDLLEKYQTRKDKNSELRNRLYQITKEIIVKEQQRILENGSPAEATSNGNAGSVLTEGVSHHIYSYELLTIDDLIEIGRGLQGQIPHKILYLFHSPTNTLLLFSDVHDCGKLVKENAPTFGGKGGGNDYFARAIFSRQDDACMFADAIDKVTRD